MLKKLYNKQGITVIATILFVVCILIFQNEGSIMGKPTMYMDFAGEVKAMSQEEFYVDIKLSDFPENGVFPASSISVQFDKNKLKFLGLRQGNMEAGDVDKTNVLIPTWTCNENLSNSNGVINAMYLDMTADQNAYRFYGFEKGQKDILLRLSFALRDSASSGEKLKLEFSDAVMASINDGEKNSSLSMAEKTLKVTGETILVK